MIVALRSRLGARRAQPAGAGNRISRVATGLGRGVPPGGAERQQVSGHAFDQQWIRQILGA
ncbi:MAG: hypothetical protein MZV70_39690 [Desulfobacterales bacterium]|nr:hypothetical protein [Desulfobacterales bacterium]